MSLKSLIKAAKKALPVLAANAPALIKAAKEIRKAVKKRPNRPKLNKC